MSQAPGAATEPAKRARDGTRARRSQPAGAPPPTGGSHRFRRGLLFFTVVFAALVLLDVALVGHLIFRDFSGQVINEARVRSRQEAENIARRLSPGAGAPPAADIYRVVETTRMFARYLDRVLQKYLVIQEIQILDSEGKSLYSRARRAEILRKDGGMQPEETSPLELGPPLNPVPGAPSAEIPPGEPVPDPAELLLARMGIPLPAVQLGPGAPASVARFGHRRSAYDVMVPLPGRDGFVKVSLSEKELARELADLRHDLIIKILIGAGLSLVLILVAYIFVVRLFNKTRRLEAEAQMADRLAYVGTLAAGLAHEIRNPLSAMKLNLQMLESSHGAGVLHGRDEEAAEAEELLRETRQEVDRLGGLVTSFLSYARPPRLDLKPADLNRIVEETVHFLQADAAQRKVTTNLDLAPGLPPLLLDEKQFRQALLNIIRNALNALETQGGGTVRLQTSQNGTGRIHLLIEDDGPGMPPERLSRIFQVFYSARPGGTGLGLSIALRVVEGHDGRIHVKSAVGSGTRFTVSLPAPASNRTRAAL